MRSVDFIALGCNAKPQLEADSLGDIALPVDDLDEESWSIRETFAYFGRAMYMASVLETGLAHVLMAAHFMKQEKEKIIATKGREFSQEKYESDFDNFMDNQFDQTMGNLIKRVHSFTVFDDSLKHRIDEAKKRRDFLTHHYWRERSIEFSTEKGRRAMMSELNADAEAFCQLDSDIESATAEVRKSVGIDDNLVDRYIAKKMARIKNGLPWDDESSSL